jgi:hypothetical protein
VQDIGTADPYEVAGEGWQHCRVGELDLLGFGDSIKKPLLTGRKKQEGKAFPYFCEEIVAFRSIKEAN